MSEESNTTTPVAGANGAPDDFNEYLTWREQQQEAEPASEAADSTATEEETPSEAPAEPAEAESADAADTSEDDEQDEAAEPEAEAEKDDESDEAEPKKRKGGFQKRIDRLTREKRELEARLSAAEQAQAKEQPKEEAKPEPAAGKPKVQDFDSYEEFTEALTDWKLTERTKAEVAARDRAQAEEAHTAVLQTWNQRTAAVRKATPDYDEVLEAASDVPIPGYVQAALLESERGPEVAYFLAKHRADLERIVSLSPASAGREIGKIEARLEANRPVSPKPAVTRAPKPVTPIKGSKAGSPPSVYDERLADDYNAWEAQRMAQLKRK